jgi:apolipoprotein N-acyltransferase
MNPFLKNLIINLSLIALGALFTLCFAPFRYFLLGFLAFPVAYHFIINSKSSKQAFNRGFLFSMGHHVSGLYWVANSLLIEADKFAWLVPFAVLLLPAYLSLFVGGVSILTYRSKLTFYSRMVYFAGIWTFAEIARTYLFTGFPWNLSGMVFITRPEFASFASVVGVYGLSFIAILFYTTPYTFYENLHNIRHNGPMRAALSMKYFLPILVFSMASGLNGLNRMKNDETDVNIRIVQPSIPQIDKFDINKVQRNNQRYESLTQQPSKIEGFMPNIIVWPEAATPYYFERDNWLSEVLSAMIPPQSHLILGSLRADTTLPDSVNAYNSVRIVSAGTGLLPEYYDKAHLVPFGEYIPLRSLFPNVEKLTHGMGDFAHGSGNKNLELPNAPPFLPLICYEVIFSPRVAGKDFTSLEKRPGWILNVTNDSWFGDSTGPHQHLDITRMRAIESGLPVIRAANNGISAVIDAYGRVVQSLPYNEIGIIDAKLPKALPEPTFYSKHGLKVPLIGIFAIIFWIRLKNRLKIVNS